MPTYDGVLNSVVPTSSRTPDWSSAYRSSCERCAGLMYTRTAPIFAVAYWTSADSATFGAEMPTR